MKHTSDSLPKHVLQAYRDDTANSGCFRVVWLDSKLTLPSPKSPSAQAFSGQTIIIDVFAILRQITR